VTTAGAWATANSMANARRAPGGAGIQTAALAFGGESAPGGPLLTATEEYDGTNWASSNPLNTARRSLASAGTQTAALAAGGEWYSTYSSNRRIQWINLDNNYSWFKFSKS
jgi:hypothetical protein